MKVIHVTTGLHVGGAEMMLLKLLGAMDRQQFAPTVISLVPGGECRTAIEALGIPVHDLGLKPGQVTPGGVLALRRLGKMLTPDVIQGWMYHGNTAATLLAKFVVGEPRLYWNIRHAVHDLGHEKRTTRALIRLGAMASRRPAGIIFNSAVSLQQHAALGYHRDGCLVIPNGFDTAVFKPDPAAGPALRRQLHLAPQTPVVGMVARLHPHKGHLNFLAAAERVHGHRPDVHFVMVGSGVTEMDPELGGFLLGKSLRDRVHLLGPRNDVARLMPGLDLLCVSSVTEAFPNVLGEAMSCGVPCVSTEVGEAAAIIGPTGSTVPADDPAALASGLLELLQLDAAARAALGEQGRRRISERYSLAAVARRFAALYQSGTAGASAV